MNIPSNSHLEGSLAGFTFVDTAFEGSAGYSTRKSKSKPAFDDFWEQLDRSHKPEDSTSALRAETPRNIDHASKCCEWCLRPFSVRRNMKNIKEVQSHEGMEQGLGCVT